MARTSNRCAEPRSPSSTSTTPTPWNNSRLRLNASRPGAAPVPAGHTNRGPTRVREQFMRRPVTPVPEGLMKIARQFTGGMVRVQGEVLETGRLKTSDSVCAQTMGFLPPSFWGKFNLAVKRYRGVRTHLRKSWVYRFARDRSRGLAAYEVGVFHLYIHLHTSVFHPCFSRQDR